MEIGIHSPASESSRGPNIAAAAAASAARGTSSLERTLDEATDRYAVSPEVQRELRQLKAGLSGAAALAVNTPQTEALSLAPQRLRWRGREVSDAFQRYAERVASGEELAPYHGQVLARPCVDSPWGVPEPPLPAPVRRSVVVGALLASSAWLVGVLLVAPRPPAPNAELRLLPTTALYATPAASGQLGALSQNDSPPLGDVASGELRSRDGDVARALGPSITSQRATRAVSARRRGARSVIAVAPFLAPAAAGAPGAGAPPASASEATDDFAWLLDGAEGTAAATVDEGAALDGPPGVHAAELPAAGGGTRASVGAAPSAVPASALLLETPPF